jgi:hypothetical protein
LQSFLLQQPVFSIEATVDLNAGFAWAWGMRQADGAQLWGAGGRFCIEGQQVRGFGGAAGGRAAINGKQAKASMNAKACSSKKVNQ